MKAWFRTAHLLTLIITIFSVAATAMVIRHDVSPKKYLVDESRHPAIFPLIENGNSKECVATLIDKHWAVTAAHCTLLVNRSNLTQQPHSVSIANQANYVTQVFIPKQYGSIEAEFDNSGNPIKIKEDIKDQTYDIALLKLKNTVKHVRPISLFETENEVGKKILLLGWGDYGTGEQGILPDTPINDGKFRAAWNQITAIQGNFFVFDFDAPNTSSSLPLEGVNGPGDSGGPALVKTNNEYLLIGVSSGGGYPNSMAEKMKTDIRYGWREYYVRVSKMRQWLIGTMASNR